MMKRRIPNDLTETSCPKARARIVAAREGKGPLLQRDYWVLLQECGASPQQVMTMVREHFAELSPRELAHFRSPEKAPPKAESELKIQIALAGVCGVRLVHEDATSFTLRTLEGHPEAGRITFGARRTPEGALEFRIRSRARARDRLRLLGYLVFGKSMQTDTWVEFVTRVARVCGGAAERGVQIAERAVADEPADEGLEDLPTFLTGDFAE